MKFNLEQLQQACGNDIEFACDLMNTMIRDGQQRVQAIQQASEQQDWACVGRHAHALKGAALNLGAEDLSHLCGAIDDSLRLEGPPPSRHEILALLEEFERLVTELKQSVERLSQ